MSCAVGNCASDDGKPLVICYLFQSEKYTMQIIMASLTLSPLMTKVNGYDSYLLEMKYINEHVGRISRANEYMSRVYPDYGHYMRRWWWLDGKEFMLIIDEADRLDEVMYKRNELLAYKFNNIKYMPQLDEMLSPEDDAYFPF